MALVENNTLEGLPQMGQDLGDFMSNLAPGVGKFLLIMAIFVGIGGLIGGIIYLVRKKAKA